jgi:hypothetical protein
MKSKLSALALAVAALLAEGCCCCRCGPDVPVDCEDFCACLQYHGPDCCEYPYSCPRCPYFDYQQRVWRAPYFQTVEHTVVETPQPPVQIQQPVPRVARHR